jgi:hypothetical protein
MRKKPEAGRLNAGLRSRKLRKKREKRRKGVGYKGPPRFSTLIVQRFPREKCHGRLSETI